VSPSTEIGLRLGASLGIFLVMALWERAAPVRELTARKPRRWLRNLAVAVLNAVVVRLVAPAGAVGVALWAEAEGIGLLHRIDPPEAVAVVGSILLLDLVIYAQHVAFHQVPLLWRLHMVHHTDEDVDVTTGQRFHPVEILLSMGIKALVVLGIGAPPLAVLLFEVILNGSALFNHSNARLPRRADRILRLLLVTPDMHRVHHSVERREHDSNYGFNVPWWDRLFGTYRDQPEAGHRGMTLGLRNQPDAEHQSLPWFVTAPFRRRPPGH
jgi:sterol desaturase/sphingolipid hydroxylase (fatty acid hydroxylase superfamily)